MIDERLELPATADERTQLTCFLEFQRDALVRKCAGISDDQLRRRAVPTSNLSLLGLVRHLAGVERWYFQCVIGGRSPGSLFDVTDDPNEDFNDLDSATGESTFAMWHGEIEQSRRIAGALLLEHVGTVPGDADEIEAGTAHPTHGRSYSLRWVLLHMIDEYARHLGQADMVREAIDGQVGE